MTQILLDGVIGYDIDSKNIREQFALATGDVEILVNSPGGVVTDGIAIYNAIREYKRKKQGTVTARVVGMAASMATYIPMAADVIEIEDNAIWMIHNPWGVSIGDYQEMKKEAQILDSLAKILARAYVEKTGRSLDDIRAMMDDETYLYGEDIKTQGFADVVVPAGEGPEDKEEAIALAKSRLNDAKAKIKELEDGDRGELVAMIRDVETVVDGEATAKEADIKKGEVMDIMTLKNEYPEVFAQAVALGKDQEKERIGKLNAYVTADPGNDKVAVVVQEAIMAGKTESDVLAQLQVALRDGKKETGENPALIATAQDPMSGLDDIDRQAMEAFGLSIEDVRKAKGVK